jgi:pimeloyl-ACP methyl ester carboxylesterase
VRLRRSVDEIDIVDLLPQIKAPTLVLHCRNDAVQPFDEGRRLAAGIPGARFVALEGRNHLGPESLNHRVYARFELRNGECLLQGLGKGRVIGPMIPQ